jgi:hypothetical protein
MSRRITHSQNTVKAQNCRANLTRHPLAKIHRTDSEKFL